VYLAQNTLTTQKLLEAGKATNLDTVRSHVARGAREAGVPDRVTLRKLD